MHPDHLNGRVSYGTSHRNTYQRAGSEVAEIRAKEIIMNTRKRPDVSIVIPCFNAEPYIESCLKSIYTASWGSTKFEVLVIDDGSIDEGMNLARMLVERSGYSNFEILSTPRLGPGGARNAGAMSATGTFIWYVDADDEIISQAIDEICKAALRQRPDVIWFSFAVAYPNGDVVVSDHSRHRQPSRSCVMSGAEFLAEAFSGEGMVWSFWFRRDFLLTQKLCFAENTYYEDTLYTFQALAQAERIISINVVAYLYFLRANSIMRNPSNTKKLGFDALWVAAKINDIKVNTPGARDFFHRYSTRSACLVLKHASKIDRETFDMAYAWSAEQRLIPLKVCGRISEKLQASILNFWPGGFYQLAKLLAAN